MKPTFVLVVVWFGLAVNLSQADIIADLRGDFVAGTSDGDPASFSASNTGTWEYLASDTINPADDVLLDFLVWDTAVGGGPRYDFWTSGGSQDSAGLHNPNATSTELVVGASAISRPPSFTVLRWIAGVGEGGTITVDGNFRKLLSGGDGMTLDIFVDGTSHSSFLIAGSDTVGTEFDFDVSIADGWTVDFVVGPNVNDVFGLAGLELTVSSAIPEPSSCVVLWLAVLGAGFTRFRIRN